MRFDASPSPTSSPPMSSYRQLSPKSAPLKFLPDAPELLPLKTAELWDIVFTNEPLHNNNSVLAMLGDTIFQACVSEWLMDEDVHIRKSDMLNRLNTRLAAPLLASYADRYELMPHLRASHLDFAHRSEHTRATLFRAYIGAMHKDYGYETVRTWVYELMDWDDAIVTMYR